MIAPASLAGIHVYFPDPWPKKRHHKRRLLQAARSCTRSRSGSRRAATCTSRPTGQQYAEEMLAALVGRAAARQHGGGLRAASGMAPADRFEARGMRLGHEVFDLAVQARLSARGGVDIR